ncbi:Nucleoside-diphosphate-sugar epimerase [Arthrobacter alpinus]|uniref:Nucleoside-diphosphate-sugar epimerase n=1 Tax=Arthrobacter alpinus TaxID=656366 RepID=A0A1H5DZI9_9MICC|nr:NAD-dependent epimerase/dehydratase family protein [Arthrobacter alpinus]SED84196.1 Nucleoside-diphosphate-sugar epimerase [Arthrobacter alpinus]
MVMGPRVLFIGGTGIISTAAVARAVALGFTVTVLNRAASSVRPVPSGVELVIADIRDTAAVAAALGARTFDVVADFITFAPDQARAAVDLFRDRTRQYVFISTASAYQKPPARLPITESTPLRNPFWKYSQDKISCEEVFTAAYRDEGFPVMVVRPSSTYDHTRLPLLFGWTDVHRMREGLPVVVHGDGTTPWTLTHAVDFAVGFVGLFGLPVAGEAFTITSDDVLSWDSVYRHVAAAAGVTDPMLVHVASDRIAAVAPDFGPGLLGDKSHPAIFDNTRIKSLVPSFGTRIRFSDAIVETLAWHDRHPESCVVNSEHMAFSQRLAEL